MTARRLCPPTRITADLDLAAFNCGVPSLDDWLRHRAVKNQHIGASRSYVVRDGATVVGYYCLSAGAVVHEEAPGALRRNTPDPIPTVVLGRLAVNQAYQELGIGSALLRDAVQRFLQVANVVGAAALLVHALSDNGRRFYISRGFVESPIRPITLCLMLRTATDAVQRRSGEGEGGGD
jgi:GNAT superfamily N-acetyltransferase